MAKTTSLDRLQMLITEFSNPRAYIVKYLSSRSLSISHRGEFRGAGVSSKSDPAAVLAGIRLDYGMAYNAARSAFQMCLADHNNERARGEETLKLRFPEKFGKADLEDALTHTIEEVKNLKLAEVANVIAYDPGAPNPWPEFLSVVLANPTEFDEAKFKHFIWQVKSRFHDHPIIRDEMMINLYGPQGCGKTETVKRIIEPFSEFHSKLSFGDLTDTKLSSVMNSSFVIVLDEMSKAGSADMEMLKTFMSQRSIDYRPLYSNLVVRTTNNSTLISTSNKHMSEFFYDPTGMRRFCQVEFNPHAVANHLEYLTNFDYVSLWKCVDETKPSPIEAFRAELIEHQAELTSHSSVMMYINARNLEAVQEFDYPAAELREDYVQFCKDNALPTISGGSFASEIRRAIKSAATKRKASGMFYNLKYNNRGTALDDNGKVIG